MFTQHIEYKSLYDKSQILISNVNELCRQYKHLKQLKIEYENSKIKLNAISGGNGKRNLNDVSNEYDGLSNENNNKNELQQNLRNKINSYDYKKRNMHNKLIELQQKSSKFEKLNMEKNTIEKELNLILINENNFKNELQKIKHEINPILNKIKNKKNIREQERILNKNKLNKLQLNLNKFSSDISNLQNKISELLNSNNKISKFENFENELIIRENEYKSLIEKYNGIEKQKYDLNKWLDNVIIDKQDLDSNLEFRKFKQLISDKKKEFQNLKTEMNRIHSNSENINNEIDETRTQIAIEQSNLDQNFGGMNSEKRKAISLMDELRTDRYKDIDEKYRQQLIKYETILIASRDLDKFEKALDKSLIEFHSLKMREINSVLKELWQQTYRGRDIDYVEIRSEIGGSNNKKRKNYNYNVIMKQGDANLTMRGRCSAGQRVLAGLLIRLALAETFCLNCGVLALDEPTTNLDSKNIEALAYALNQIITRRKRHENFQLILITHDEQFVEKLGQREHTDGYYRVFKDDFQHSKAKLYKFDGRVNQNNNNNNNRNRE